MMRLIEKMANNEKLATSGDVDTKGQEGDEMLHKLLFLPRGLVRLLCPTGTFFPLRNLELQISASSGFSGRHINAWKEESGLSAELEKR